MSEKDIALDFSEHVLFPKPEEIKSKHKTKEEWDDLEAWTK